MNLSGTYADLIDMAYSNTPPDGYIILSVLPSRFGWVLQNKETGVIVIDIDGTKNIQDFIKDAEFKLVRTELGYIHTGFYSDYTLIFPYIYDTIKRQNIPNIRVDVIGHSLGAAINSLLSLSLVTGWSPNFTNLPILVNTSMLRSFTYGSPRVGDGDFIYRYRNANIETYRFQNKLDIVTYVPDVFGYGHVCDAIEFSAGIIGDIEGNHSIGGMYKPHAAAIGPI